MLFKEELTIAFLSALTPLPVHYTCTVFSEKYHFLVQWGGFKSDQKTDMERDCSKDRKHFYIYIYFKHKTEEKKVSGRWQAVLQGDWVCLFDNLRKMQNREREVEGMLGLFESYWHTQRQPRPTKRKKKSKLC